MGVKPILLRKTMQDLGDQSAQGSDYIALVDIRTIERYISANAEELKQNGYELLRGRELKAFLRCYNEHFGTDIYVGTKTTVMGVFDFRAFLDIAMLLSESEKARAIRQVILDVVIDLISRKTGGGISQASFDKKITKYHIWQFVRCH